VESPDLDAFAARAMKQRPQDPDGAPLDCYVRIRTGSRQSHARVAASGIKLHHGDPARLAADLRDRLAGLCGDPSAPRAWVEVLVKGEPTPWDTVAVPLTADTAPAMPGDETTADKAVGWVIVRQADALVRLSEQATRRAELAEGRASQLVESLAQTRARVRIAEMEAQTEVGRGEQVAAALDRMAPLAVAALSRGRVALPGPTAGNGAAEEPAAEEPAEPPDPEELADEVLDLLDQVPGAREALAARLATATATATRSEVTP